MGLAVTDLNVPGCEPWRADLAQPGGIDLHGEYSSERIGGDLFDAVRVGPRVAFLLSDVEGRRPELDPILQAMQQTFRASAAELFGNVDGNLTEGIEMLVHSINHALIDKAQGVCFAPTMVGCYDVQLGVLAYVNAGGQTALLYDSEGTRALPNVSMPLGLFAHWTYDASMQALEPGAILLVVTKGVTERMGGQRPVDPQRMIEVLQRSRGESASGMCRAVLEAASGFGKRRLEWLPFRGKPKRDDMTALIMVRKSEAKTPFRRTS